MKTADKSYVQLEYNTSLQCSIHVDKYLADRFIANNRSQIEEADWSDNALARRIIVTMLGWSNPKNITYRTPTNWFQMLKRDHAPAWFLARFPVKEKVETVEIKDIYPFPTEKMPDSLGPCIRIATIKRFNAEDGE